MYLFQPVSLMVPVSSIMRSTVLYYTIGFLVIYLNQWWNPPIPTGADRRNPFDIMALVWHIFVIASSHIFTYETYPLEYNTKHWVGNNSESPGIRDQQQKTKRDQQQKIKRERTETNNKEAKLHPPTSGLLGHATNIASFIFFSSLITQEQAYFIHTTGTPFVLPQNATPPTPARILLQMLKYRQIASTDQ
jgi:hypothetical protein